MTGQLSNLAATTGGVAMLALLATLVGSLAGKKGVAGVAAGFLTLCGAANTALLLVRNYRFSAILIVPLALALTLLFAALIRSAMPQDGALGLTTGEMLKWRRIPSLCIPLTVVLAAAALPLYPYASANFFDAWGPLWVKESLEAGRFLVPADTSLGRGFLTSAEDYEWNVLGLIALLSAAIPLSPVLVSIAVQYCAKLLTLLLIYAAIAPPLALALPIGLALFVTVFADSGAFTMLAGRSWDDVFLLASAAVFYAAAVPGDRDQRRKMVIIFSMFLGWGRKYAFVYGALFALCAACLLVKHHGWKSAMKVLLPAGCIGLLSILRPVQLFLEHQDLFYPRTNLLQVYPRGGVKSLMGIVSDIGWADGVDKLHLFLPSATALWAVLLLLLLTGRKEESARSFDKMSIFFPLLLIAAPILLETVTGFRKSTGFSKLFVCAVPFVLGYVWVVFRELGYGAKGRRMWFGSKSFIVVVCVFMLLSAVQFRRIAVWFASTAGFLDNSPAELKMVQQLRKSLPTARYRQVVERPTVYLHYEPGIGYRFFAGGKLSKDLDFWSDEFQNTYAEAKSARLTLSRLGFPNLYVSHTPFYDRFTVYGSADAFLAELSDIDRLNCITAGDGSKFYYYGD